MVPEKYEETVRMMYHPKTDTILLGFVIGSAKVEEGELTVIASGRTVRMTLEGYEGYVDVDIKPVVEKAYKILREQHDA